MSKNNGISKDSIVEFEGKKISVAALFKMGPALGLTTPDAKVAAPASNPAKPVRRIVGQPIVGQPPSAATSLSKAISDLKPGAGAVLTVVAAPPKQSKTFQDVTIVITKESIETKEGEAPVEMLVLSKRCISDGKGKSKAKKGTEESHFNYPFDKGFCYYSTKGATPPKPSWKWDSVREVRFVPVSEVETLLSGLRMYYPGAKLIIGDHTEIL